jgi:hypothetical protein
MKTFKIKNIIGTFALVLLTGLFLGSCEDDTTERPDRLVERPTMAAFFCAVENESGEKEWKTTSECDSEDENNTFYSLVVSSSRGELALINLEDKKIVDLDPDLPGYNHLPMGFPVEKIVLDDSTGDIIVLSRTPVRINRISINSILARTRGEQTQETIVGKNVSTSEGKLRSTPSDMIIHEESSAIYVLFPHCSLLARVTSDGTILDSWKTGEGTELLVNSMDTPRCPAEGPVLDQSAPVDDGEFAEIYPYTMEIDGNDLYIGYSAEGGESSDQLLHATLDASGNIGAVESITVVEGTKGWRKLRISPETRWGKFLYGITRNGDVRVIRLSDNVECDANIDTREIAPLDIDDDLRGCMAAGSLKRNFVAKGPGITLGNSRKILDVSFFSFNEVDDSTDYKQKSAFLGTFAVLLSMDGILFLVNLDENFSSETYEYRYGSSYLWPEEVIAHRIRNTVEIEGSYSNNGRPRMNEIVSYYENYGVHYLTEGEPDIYVTDDASLQNVEGYLSRMEMWSVTWEGNLPDTARNSGVMENSGDNTLFEDLGGSFCSRGVRPGDILRVTGCYDDYDCLIGYSCGRTPIQPFDSYGLCFPEDLKNDFVVDCSQILASDREYLISEVLDSNLVLAPNVLYDPSDEDPLSPHSCTENIDCFHLGVEQGGVCGSDGVCVSAPSPLTDENRWCLGGMLNYEVRVDDAFLLRGGITGYESPYTTDSTGSCVLKSEETFDFRLSGDPGRKETPFFSFDIARDPQVSIPWRYELRFIVDAGYSQYYGDLAVRLPSWMGIGPDGNIYLTDMGDTGSITAVIGQFVKVVPEYFALDTEFIIR